MTMQFKHLNYPLYTYNGANIMFELYSKHV